jgi:hypothetical protein
VELVVVVVEPTVVVVVTLTGAFVVVGTVAGAVTETRPLGVLT